MTRSAILSMALVLGVPAAAQDKAPPAPASQAGSGTPSPKLQNLLQNCDAHKFETTVESTVNGQPHRSKVKMCGNEGQSDADWIKSLQDAIAKLKANKDIAADTRNQIITAIQAEIARLQGKGSLDTQTSELLPPPRADVAKPLSDDYALLPPLPKVSSPPPPHVLEPGATTTSETASDVSLQPAPSQGIAPPPASSASPPPAKPLSIANARLNFSCISPEFAAGGPCVTLSRDTILKVKAPQAVTVPVSLRFVRQGEARAEIALGMLRKGQSVRLEVPQAVCSGVVTSEVQVEVVGSGQVLDRQGPYLLHC
jgi:hypothetical protein